MGMKISDFSNHFNNLVEATIYNSLPSGLNIENFAIPVQTHSCNVKFIKQPGKYENVDGLISSFDYKIPLIISVADCVPIYIFDIETYFYGVVNSGWIGTKGKIIKNALKSGAKAIFQGKIFVASKAQKTDGYQMSNGLILTDDCEFLVKPELEIYADDVVCSHGSISGTLNDDHLFYLRSRGIPLNEAQKQLIQAFFSEILDEVSDDNIVYYIQNQISEMLTL